MRPLIIASLLVGFAACRGSTSPDTAVINVRVRDDAGASAGPNLVIVSHAGKPDVHSRTGSNGNADIGVADAGVYEVTVVPRNAYHGGPELSKTVTVSENARAMLDFTVHRVGVSTADGPPESPIGR